MSAQARGPALLLIPTLGLFAVFWCQFGFVRATNFGGFDEWLFLELGSRGILGSPYSNRPLNFLWTTPAALLTPASFTGFFVLHATYLALAGAIVLCLCRRLLPERPRLGLLAAVFALVWAPNDVARLSSVQMSVNSGFGLGTLLALLLLVESWRSRSRPLLVVASLWAVAMIRGYEGVAPVLLGAPLLLVREARRRPAQGRLWASVWAAALALAVVLALLPVVQGGAATSYQSLLGIDLNPLHAGRRLATQFQLHLAPLFTTSFQPLATPAAALSLLAFLALFAWVSRSSDPEPPASRELAGVFGLGSIFAALGYAPFVLTDNVAGATRTEFFAMPGIGLLLAALIAAVAGLLPSPLRAGAMGILGAWVVVVGAGRSVDMQRYFDRISYYQPQVQALRELTQLAPELLPNTLVVLIDDGAVFPASFTFRHAVEYLYPGRATGYVPAGLALLYPARFTPQGVLVEPWPVLREAWSEPVRSHRFDEIVIVARRGTGKLGIVSPWPSLFPPLPEGARYDPLARVLSVAARPDRRAILDP